METVAVVCDDNIECHEDRDEKRCTEGGSDTFAYVMTFITSLIYVVLKLVWWFHWRHISDDDEEDIDMTMEDTVVR